MSSSMSPRGALTLNRIGVPDRPDVSTVADALRYGAPRLEQPEAIRDWKDANWQDFQRSLDDMALFESRRLGPLGTLWARVLRADGAVDDLGLVSCRVVTNAGVYYLVDAMQGLVEPENLRYHGLGTGTTSESTGQTALAAELTTQYSTASTRPQGSLGEQSGAANVFETTATITVGASVAVTEHGIFSQAAVPGGVMLDRSVFAAVNLAASESLQATYRLTFPSGG